MEPSYIASPLLLTKSLHPSFLGGTSWLASFTSRPTAGVPAFHSVCPIGPVARKTVWYGSSSLGPFQSTYRPSRLDSRRGEAERRIDLCNVAPESQLFSIYHSELAGESNLGLALLLDLNFSHCSGLQTLLTARLLPLRPPLRSCMAQAWLLGKPLRIFCNLGILRMA